VVSGTEHMNSTSLFLQLIPEKATKGLIALTPEMDCGQAAMDLPSAVFLIAKVFLAKCICLERMSEMSLLTFWGKKSEWCVCM
jgi:hypothetical protein